MREKTLRNMAYWAREEEPDYIPPTPPVKPVMVDKTQDTQFDIESFKEISCTCRVFDSDVSITQSKSEIHLVPDASHVECLCFEQKGKTFLDAVFTGNSDLLELCLDQDPSLMKSTDENGDTALHMVSDRGDIDMLKFLLGLKGINVNVQNISGLTPLAIAVIGKHDESAKILLEHRANPNIADNRGRTPIIFSVANGSIEMTRLLIEYGADVNVVDSFGNTPLSTALTDYPLLTLVKVLLSCGANPLQQNNRLNPFLETVLECTTEKKLEMVKALVQSGVNVNVLEPTSGRNCLHLTGINGFLPLAEYLVNSGADLEVHDMAHRNPHQVAFEHNNQEVADFFLKAMHMRRVIEKQNLIRISKNLRKLTLSSMFYHSFS